MCYLQLKLISSVSKFILHLVSYFHSVDTIIRKINGFNEVHLTSFHELTDDSRSALIRQ
jgi:hypothetical protein